MGHRNIQYMNNLLSLIEKNKANLMKHLLLIPIFLLSLTSVTGQETRKIFGDGLQLLKDQKFKKAERKFSEVIRKGDSAAVIKMAWIFKGHAYLGQKEYVEAIDCYTTSLALDSLDPATYCDRGIAWSFKGDYGMAASDFYRVLRIDSVGKQAENAYYHLGKIHMLSGRNAEAIPFFDSLLDLAPADAEGYFLRGTAKSNIHDIDGSISDFDLAIRYNPDYMEAYANRGVQKLNKIPLEERSANFSDCLEDPCADLLKAKKLGDTSLDDLIYLYCKNCK